MIWKIARESAFNYYKTFSFFVPQLLSTKEPIKIGVHVYPFQTHINEKKHKTKAIRSV